MNRQTKTQSFAKVQAKGRSLKNGLVSWYLDYRYQGKRVRENLSIQTLSKEALEQATPRERNEYKEQLLLIDQLRTKRQAEVTQAGLMDKSVDEVRVTKKKAQQGDSFFAYYDKVIGYKDNDNTRYQYENTRKYLVRYNGSERLSIKAITKDWVRGFQQWLAKQPSKQNKHTTLSKNTQSIAMRTFKAVINSALDDGIITADPTRGIKNVKGTQKLVYLTTDELKRFVALHLWDDERYSVTWKAYLFCCIAGLRYSDVSSITWEHITYTKVGAVEDYVLEIIQKKGNKPLKKPIPENALPYLGTRPRSKAERARRIFPLSNNETTNNHIRVLMRLAGIDKEGITFHSSRHTYATRLSESGEPIQVIKHELGHSSIQTTMVYAHHTEEQSRRVSSKINELIDELNK